LSYTTIMTEAAALKRMQPVVQKIVDYWAKMEKGDVDTDHCTVLFATNYPAQVAKDAILAKIDLLITPSTRVLATTPMDVADDIVLKLTQFRFDPKMSQKGLSRMPDIWERLRQMFPCGLQSAEERLQPFFPQVGGALVHHQSVGIKIGMAKICCCYMIAIAAVEHLNEEERILIEGVLKTFGKVHGVWNNVRDQAAVVFSAMLSKNSRSLTSRVDPEQLLAMVEKLRSLRQAFVVFVVLPSFFKFS